MKMNEFKNSAPYTTDDNENQIENVSLIKPSSTDHPLYNDVVNACKTVFDPEIPVDIYELGLIYDVFVNEDNDVKILMTLTTPNCPVAESLPLEVKNKIAEIEGVKSSEVEMTFDPPWTRDLMSEEAKLELGFL